MKKKTFCSIRNFMKSRRTLHANSPNRKKRNGIGGKMLITKEELLKVSDKEPPFELEANFEEFLIK